MARRFCLIAGLLLTAARLAAPQTPATAPTRIFDFNAAAVEAGTAQAPAMNVDTLLPVVRKSAELVLKFGFVGLAR